MTMQIKETVRKIYRTSSVSEDKKSMNIYEFSQTKNGWLIIQELHHVDLGMQARNEVWVPNEIIEKIAVESVAKDHLLEKE